MSRSGFYEMDDYDQDTILAMGRHRGQIASATRGKRGQAFLKLALSALDKMEDKRLAGGTFGVGDGGCMCLMTSIATETGRASVLSAKRCPYDGEGTCHDMAATFNVAPILIQDLVWYNDGNYHSSPAERWKDMRRIVASSIKADAVEPTP